MACHATTAFFNRNARFLFENLVSRLTTIFLPPIPHFQTPFHICNIRSEPLPSPISHFHNPPRTIASRFSSPNDRLCNTTNKFSHFFKRSVKMKNRFSHFYKGLKNAAHRFPQFSIRIRMFSKRQFLLKNPLFSQK